MPFQVQFGEILQTMYYDTGNAPAMGEATGEAMDCSDVWMTLYNAAMSFGFQRDMCCRSWHLSQRSLLWAQGTAAYFSRRA